MKPEDSSVDIVDKEEERSWKKIVRNITVEPSAAVFVIAYAISELATQNILLQKSCYSNLNYTDAECDSYAAGDKTNQTKGIESEAQKIVSGISTWKPVPEYLIPTIIVIFAGSWSDKHGRKPLMLVPLVGAVLSSILMLIAAAIKIVPPELAAVMSFLPLSLAGSRTCFSLGVQSYLCDIADERSRTMRMGIGTSCMLLGAPIGAAVAGILYQNIGFFGVYGVTGAMFLLAFIYLFFMVKEEKREDSHHGSWKTLFRPENFLDSFKVTFRSRKGTKRVQIVLCIFLYLFNYGPFVGEFSILYLYVRNKFGWDEVEYGLYCAFKTVIILIGTVVSMVLFSRKLKMDDVHIGIMASVSQLSAAIFQIFINIGWLMYIVPFVDILSGAGMAVVRPIISKIVPGNEIGKVMSFVGVLESIAPVMINPIYNAIYSRALEDFPNAVFFFSVALGVPAIIIFSLVCILRRREKNESKEGAPS